MLVLQASLLEKSGYCNSFDAQLVLLKKALKEARNFSNQLRMVSDDLPKLHFTEKTRGRKVSLPIKGVVEIREIRERIRSVNAF